jgi:hypothetical protein
MLFSVNYLGQEFRGYEFEGRIKDINLILHDES